MQAGLAKKSGLAIRTIQNWEIGHRSPRAEPLLALADALDVQVSILLEEMVKDAKSAKKSRGRVAKKK
jgi:transcriptional regulator with XRE-family HTH domain